MIEIGYSFNNAREFLNLKLHDIGCVREIIIVCSLDASLDASKVVDLIETSRACIKQDMERSK